MQNTSSPSVSDHSTGYGAELALQARAGFKRQVGPYAAFNFRDDRATPYFAYVGEAKPGLCACGLSDCQVDRLAADLAALELIPGPEAELQHFLAYCAYRIAWDACMGSQGASELLLGLPAATRSELARERAWQRRRDDADRAREWQADDRG